MKKYYIAVAVLVVVLGLMYLQCSTSKSVSSSGGGNGGNSVDVTYYYNPGCPHCKNFMPVWKDFTSSGGANFTEINCSANPEKCQGVRGVPWVVFSKAGGAPVPFTGSRDKQSLQGFLNTMN